jgi:hypothetical protein
MADLKISALTSATTPLAGTEVLPIVQSGTTVKVAVSNLTAGRSVSMSDLTTSGTVTLNGGTANGVTYLNGSKVLTSGTALVFTGVNLGVGVTPSAWGGAVKALQVGSGAALYDFGSANVLLGSNAYFDGTNSKYISTDFASYYQQNNSVHTWAIAASGTAGNNITFTSAMTLNASGNLGIGTTSPNASAILDVQSTTKGVRMPNMTTTQKNAIASPAAGLMVFDTTLVKLCVYSGTAWETITSV